MKMFFKNLLRFLELYKGGFRIAKTFFEGFEDECGFYRFYWHQNNSENDHVLYGSDINFSKKEGVTSFNEMHSGKSTNLSGPTKAEPEDKPLTKKKAIYKNKKVELSEANDIGDFIHNYVKQLTLAGATDVEVEETPDGGVRLHGYRRNNKRYNEKTES
jgi:hypothetical protein